MDHPEEKDPACGDSDLSQLGWGACVLHMKHEPPSLITTMFSAWDADLVLGAEQIVFRSLFLNKLNITDKLPV